MRVPAPFTDDALSLDSLVLQRSRFLSMPSGGKWSSPWNNDILSDLVFTLETKSRARGVLRARYEAMGKGGRAGRGSRPRAEKVGRTHVPVIPAARQPCLNCACARFVANSVSR